MRHLEQEIPVKKTKGWEQLQGQLSDDQPGQEKLRWPCRHRKIWRKEPEQTTND
jgi:hypothetical protein